MALADDEVELAEPALWVRQGAPPVMRRPHRHDDLELNLVHAGRLDYLFGGSYLRVEAGEVALFWGGTPHQLVDPGATPTDVSWVHIPLTEVLSWTLPAEQVAVLLRAWLVVVPATALVRDVAALFTSWHHDVLDGGHSTVVMLEAQAFVRRVLAGVAQDGSDRGRGPGRGRGPTAEPVSAPQSGAAGRAAEMAQFVAEHYRSPITASDVARAVHLSPSHAMTLFKRVVGTTVGTYIARCRVAEAQRLLITSDRTTAEIAHAAGFTAQSSFYDTFRQVCGVAPGDYRRSFR
ncbi:helix-turn-helix domain-containing protein [Promicromonospora iranensis]|uniref:AraC-like DNA-binding protein n=1 Tax=Promicromonospora iranensis TaxID=1105144 RepID=A0ABU2CUX9_9MICO|nr:helix-turn-helix domain-containing protein [Promicromonospora iranensis]MDR7385151.1 AraC-like DNA-binding protein [Promicromonospora iranensis]